MADDTMTEAMRDAVRAQIESVCSDGNADSERVTTFILAAVAPHTAAAQAAAVAAAALAEREACAACGDAVSAGAAQEDGDPAAWGNASPKFAFGYAARAVAAAIRARSTQESGR